MTRLKLTPEEILKIRTLSNVEKGSEYHFLGYTLNLENAELNDRLKP